MFKYIYYNREGIHIFSFLICLEETYVVGPQWKHLFRLLMNTERDVFMAIKLFWVFSF